MIVSGLSDDASNSLSYYQELSDAIDDETGFNSTLELATLNNLRYDFLGKDFLVIECHGSLYKNNGVTVPMLQSYGLAKDEKEDDKLKYEKQSHYVCKKLCKRGDGGWHFYNLVTPEFFTFYYSEKYPLNPPA